MPEEMMDDDFGAAFVDAMQEDDGVQEPPAEAAPEDPTVDEPAPAEGDPASGDQAPADDQPAELPPANADDPAPADVPPADAAPDDDIEQLKTKAHGYDSMFGRLDQVRRENDQLKQRLAQLEQATRQQSQISQPQQQAQPQPAAQIPEEIREEVGEFQRQYPQFANLVTDQGQEGQSLRKLLTEYGPEVAAIQADSVVTRHQLQQQVQQVQQSVQQDRASQLVEQKRSEVLGNHPELAAVADIGPDGSLYARQGKEQELQGYLQGVDSWIRSLPYGEAEGWMRVQQQGSPAEVHQLLTAYHNRSNQQPAPRQDPNRSARAAAAGAVPSRRGSLPRSDPDENDFSGAFSAALAE